MGRQSFKDDIQSMVQSIIDEDKKRIDMAYKQIKQEVAKEIQAIIDRDMLENYYNGYEPLIYVRTMQLRKAVAPMIIDQSIGDDLAFSMAIGKDPSRMNHSKLTIKIHKKLKNGEQRTYEYGYENEKVDETLIYSNFTAGTHPNANPLGITSTPTTPTLEKATRSLDELFKEGGKIDKIIENAFKN